MYHSRKALNDYQIHNNYGLVTIRPIYDTFNEFLLIQNSYDQCRKLYNTNGKIILYYSELEVQIGNLERLSRNGLISGPAQEVILRSPPELNYGLLVQPFCRAKTKASNPNPAPGVLTLGLYDYKTVRLYDDCTIKVGQIMIRKVPLFVQS